MLYTRHGFLAVAAVVFLSSKSAAAAMTVAAAALVSLVWWSESVVSTNRLSKFDIALFASLIIQESHQETRDPNVTSLSILLFLLHLTPLMEGFPWDDLRKILHGGQRMAKGQKGEEMLPKVSTPWVVRTSVTDDRWICDSKDPNVTFG